MMSHQEMDALKMNVEDDYECNNNDRYNNNYVDEEDCKRCDESFPDRDAMKKHMTDAHDSVKKCTQCGKQFPRAINLKRHKSSVHNKQASINRIFKNVKKRTDSEKIPPTQKGSNESNCAPSRAVVGGSLEEKYELTKLLGKGGQGEVYGALRRSDGAPFAVKLKPATSRRDEAEMLRRVIGVAGCIQFEEVLKSSSAEQSSASERVGIVMEMPPRGFERCRDVLLERGQFEEGLAKTLFRQLVRTVISLHKSGIFHGDIKPDNLLVDTAAMEIKLIDFGSAICIDETQMRDGGGGGGALTEYLGSDEPPELISTGRFSAAPVTVWQLGLTFYAMLYGQSAFGSVTAPDGTRRDAIVRCRIVHHTLDGESDAEDDDAADDEDDDDDKEYLLSEDARSLIDVCLRRRPEDRWPLYRLIRHPFLAGK